MTNGLPIYDEIFARFLIHLEALPHVCITLHPILSEFPYIWGKCCFLFYQCSNSCPKFYTVQKFKKAITNIGCWSLVHCEGCWNGSLSCWTTSTWARNTTGRTCSTCAASPRTPASSSGSSTLGRTSTGQQGVFSIKSWKLPGRVRTSGWKKKCVVCAPSNYF